MTSKLLDLGSVPLRRKPGGNVWAKLARVTQFLLAGAFVAGIFACFLPVIRQVQGLERAKGRFGVAIAAEQAVNRQENQQLDLLRKNPEYIERIARDKLNLGKPGEIIFRFDPYSSKPAVPAAAMP